MDISLKKLKLAFKSYTKYFENFYKFSFRNLETNYVLIFNLLCLLLLNDIAIILLNAHYVWIKLRWVKFYYAAVWEFYKENERNFKILYKYCI